MLRAIARVPAHAAGRFPAGLFFAALLLFACTAPARGEIMVPAGTRVRLAFAETVDSRVVRKGDEIRLRVTQDVYVRGERVIARNARATGLVTSVRKPRRFGRKAEIQIDLVGVRAVDGRQIPLERYKTGDRYAAGGAAAAGGGLIILGPVGLAAGAFVKGKHVRVEAGTTIDAAVAADVKVRG